MRGPSSNVVYRDRLTIEPVHVKGIYCPHRYDDHNEDYISRHQFLAESVPSEKQNPTCLHDVRCVKGKRDHVVSLHCRTSILAPDPLDAPDCFQNLYTEKGKHHTEVPLILYASLLVRSLVDELFCIIVCVRQEGNNDEHKKLKRHETEVE